MHWAVSIIKFSANISVCQWDLNIYCAGAGGCWKFPPVQVLCALHWTWEPSWTSDKCGSCCTCYKAWVPAQWGELFFFAGGFCMDMKLRLLPFLVFQLHLNHKFNLWSRHYLSTQIIRSKWIRLKVTKNDFNLIKG